MAVICIKPNQNYAVRFYFKDCFDNVKRKYKSGFASEKKALLWEVVEKEKLENIAPSNALIFSAFIDKIWMKSRIDMNVSIATLEKYRSYVPNIKNMLGRLELQKINEQHCQAFINQYKNKPSTACEYKKILCCMFNYARRRRLLRENPMEFVIAPKYQVKKIEPYSFELVQNLFLKLKEQNSKLYTPILLALLFSLTREEVCPLLESDLSSTNYSININKALVDGYGQKQTKTQKTENRQRILYGTEEIFNEIHWYKNNNNIKTDFVCCNNNGTQMQPNTISNSFPKFLQKNKLKTITFHGLRHTFSNLCKHAGIDADTVFRMMGHGRYETTVEHYNSADPALIKKAAETLFKKMKN